MVVILSSPAKKLKVGQGPPYVGPKIRAACRVGLGPPSEPFSHLWCFGKTKGQTKGFAGGTNFSGMANPKSEIRNPTGLLLPGLPQHLLEHPRHGVEQMGVCIGKAPGRDGELWCDARPVPALGRAAIPTGFIHRFLEAR